MVLGRPQARRSRPLPRFLRTCFWDTDFLRLQWPEHQDFVVGRLLEAGGDREKDWLRRHMEPHVIGAWILRHRGRGLSPRQLRYWELIVDLPKSDVDRWVREKRRDPWYHRQSSGGG